MMDTGDLQRLTGRFRRDFPDAGPPQLCRAPGRVNLLGEHLDYNLLPVLPVTLNRHIGIAFAPLPHSVVRVYHARPDFDAGAFVNSDEPDAPIEPRWLRYGQSAIRALNRRFEIDHYPGMAAVVDGDIPPAAGLSSSSALVVAFGLAYLRILGKTIGKDISRSELAAVFAVAERQNGVPCGGMDQAVSLLGEEKFACKIDFEPLRTERVPLFRHAVFVVCNTMVAAEKTGAAQKQYAGGPAVCKLITEMIERQLRDEIDPDMTVQSLADLWYGDLCLTHGEAEELFERVFPSETTSIEDVAKRLRTKPEAIRERLFDGSDTQADTLPLRRRARHQRTEFWRVEQGRDALLANDAEYFGELMTQSHQSCAGDYEVSCDELDTLVEMASDAGALGARMTGAGFGGSAVCLVSAEESKRFADTMRNTYYRDYREMDPPKDAVFVVETSAAADYC